MAEDPQNPDQGNQQQRAQSSQELGKTLQQQKEVNEAGAELGMILKEVLQIQKDLSRELEKQGKSQRDTEISTRHEALQRKLIENSAKNSASLANKLSKYSREDLKSASKKKQFLETMAKTEGDQEILLKRIDELKDKDSKRTGGLSKLQKEVLDTMIAQYETTEDILSEAEKLKRSYTILGKLQAPFKGLENAVKSLPIVSEAFSELTKMTEKVADAYVETGHIGKAALAGMAQAGKGLLQTLGNALLVGIVQGLSGLSSASANLQNVLNLTQAEAGKLYSRLTAIASLSRGAFNYEDLQESATGLSSALGSSAAASDRTIKTVGVLTKRLGLSAEQAGSLYGFASATGQSFTGATESIIGQTEALNEATKISIRYTDILSDVANASAATAISVQQYPGGIAKAAYEARRFGLTLAQLEKTQSSLLNFSQSITDEVNAEVILGRSLNLERARYFALTNNLVGLAGELVDQADAFGGFENMFFPQQEALARAFGMTRDEAAQAIKNRKALLAIERESGIAGFAELEREEQIAELVKKYRKADIKLTLEDARIKALEALGEKEQALGAKTLKQQLQAIDATTKLKNTLGNFARDLGVFIARLIGVEDPLGRLADGIARLTEYLHEALLSVGIDVGAKPFGGGSEKAALEIAEKAQAALRGVNDLTQTQINQLTTLATEEVTDKTSKERLLQIDLAKRSLKAIENLKGVDIDKLGSSILKSGVKIGLMTSDSTRAYIEKERKYAKPVLEDLNYLINNFNFVTPEPDDGPKYLPLDIETGLKKAGGKEDTSVDVNDFTIRANPKDTLVMAGGTKFGDETNKLLERLIQAVEKGGHVYLDSRKVGESLVIGSTRQ